MDLSEASGVQIEDSIAKHRPRRIAVDKLINFTEDENQQESDEDDQPIFKQPKGPVTRRAARKRIEPTNENIELEREKLALEREKLAVEMEKLAVERERIKLQHIERECKESDTLPFKVKLQPFDPKHDDILTFLSEFDAVGDQAKWNNNLRLLQLRTLLNGDARHISSQASTSYGELKKALTDRYGKRPHEYFSELINIKKEPNETYRSLMSRIVVDLKRCIRDKDPIEFLQDEFFLKALHPTQAQWVRRNKGKGSIVDAAEDYIAPNQKFNENQRKLFHQSKTNNDQSKIPDKKKAGRLQDNIQCFNCKKWGHYSSKCPSKINLASTFSNVNNGFLHIPGKVNQQDISFVKDTGASMTLLREELVDPSCILTGQNTTLYTAIGQPFEAKLAIVNLDTPYYKGHAQVGLVPDLMADALLGMDIINRHSVNVVTRSQFLREKIQEQKSEKAMENCGVIPQDWFDENKPEDNTVKIKESVDEDQDIPAAQDISMVNADMLAVLQRNDRTLTNCRNRAFETPECVEDMPKAFYWEKDILRRKWTAADTVSVYHQVVLPECLRDSVIKLAHDQPLAGHLGVEKTKERIMKAFYWPGIFRNVSEHCMACDTCQKVAKRTNVKAPMVNTPIISEPFSKISMDIVGPLTRTKGGNKFILTIVDDATRYPEAYALKSCDAENVANCLIDLFSRVGIPKTILTDQGTNFTSELLRQLYDFLKVKGITTSPYHPAANGKTERFNATLKSMLKKLCVQQKCEWDLLLPYVLFAYREVPHEETGFAPFELLYGWPVRGPTQVIKDYMTGEGSLNKSVIEHVVQMRETLAEVTHLVKDNLENRKQRVKSWYDRSVVERKFSAGDEVLILLPSDTKKMLAQWKGPFRIVERVNDVNYRVNVGGRRGIVTYHINLLKKYNRGIMFANSDQEDHQLKLEQIFPNDQSETLQDIVINNQLTSVQKSQLKDICQAYKDIFTTIPGKCNITTHSIRTNTETPISQRPYRIPVAKREAVKQQLDDMLRQGLITPSKSAWSAPIVLVTKPDNSIRICIDYRRLNAISVSDNYPIPRISEVFEKIGSAKYLTQFDLTKGYYQIPLSEDTKDKSAFVTPYGLFQFEVMPFGMKTSPATFARLMDNVMNEYPHAVAYFDDIVIFSDTWVI